jgi:diacylglycerol kinase (ATP)
VTTREGTGARPPTARRWRRVRVIWNPNAGRKAALAGNRVSRDELVALLDRQDLGAEVCETNSPEDAEALAREAVDAGCDLVVAAGGDGTIGTVASQLVGAETTLGILPLGSVMNIARSIGLPRDLAEAVAILATGDVKSIDVGEAKGRPFYETGSVGMNAAIFREAQRFEQGDWLSIIRTVWVAFRYRPARMEIRLDDRIVRTRALMVTASNGPYVGAAMTVAPGARLDDGKFDVRLFRRFSKWQLLRHLASIAFGRRRYAPEVSTYRSERVAVDSVHPLPCRVDSHDLGTTPVEFVTLPQVLRVVVPPPERRAPGAALPPPNE